MTANRFSSLQFSRRHLLGLGLAVPALSLLAPSGALAQADALTPDVKPDTGSDVTAALQAAIDRATSLNRPLFIPAGSYRVTSLILPPHANIEGIPGQTALSNDGTVPLFRATNAAFLRLRALSLSANSSLSAANLLDFENCTDLTITDLSFGTTSANALYLFKCSGRVASCTFSKATLSAIHAQDSIGLLISQNTITGCGNGGIRVWRFENGHDGTIVTGNRIATIASSEGNGQNGNGINIFKADSVIVANNVISDCDFSAIRANATNNAQIISNNCTNCREVAIFSEFAFSGSIIANNLIDEAATGISITNLDSDGHLAVCSGNIVRNIWPASPTNPDTVPIGIFAEADVAITGNVVDTVPGVGIGLGWGEFLRNVLAAQNVVTNCTVGIGVSVVAGAGHARISGNLISGSRDAAISGYEWADRRGNDLATNPRQFANVLVEDNSIN